MEQINTKFLLIMFVILFGLFGVAPISKNTTHDVNEYFRKNTMHEKMVKVDMKQVQCMAKNIFYEASGESINGQAAVARVVLNRVINYS